MIIRFLKGQYGKICIVLFLFFCFVCCLAAADIPFCFFRRITGLPCPGCGLTHAGIAMLTGKWKESFSYHPLFLLVLFVPAVFVFRRFKPFSLLHKTPLFYIGVFLLFFILYIVRMILFFPDGPYPMVYEHASFAEKLLELLKTSGLWK